jgi:hypothetical protein
VKLAILVPVKYHEINVEMIHLLANDMVCLQTAIFLQETCLPDSNEEPGGGGKKKMKV